MIIKFSKQYHLLLYWKEKEIRCRKKLSLAARLESGGRLNLLPEKGERNRRSATCNSDNWESKLQGDDLILTQRYRNRLEKEPFGKKKGGC
jgi:hypothetical protein